MLLTHVPLPAPRHRPWTIAVIAAGHGTGTGGLTDRTPIALQLAGALATHDRHAVATYVLADHDEDTAGVYLQAYRPVLTNAAAQPAPTADTSTGPVRYQPETLLHTLVRGAFTGAGEFTALLTDRTDPLDPPHLRAALTGLRGIATDIVLDLGAPDEHVSAGYAVVLPHVDLVLALTNPHGAQAAATATLTRELTEQWGVRRGAILLTAPSDTPGELGPWPVAGTIDTGEAVWRAHHDDLTCVPTRPGPLHDTLVGILHRARILSGAHPLPGAPLAPDGAATNGSPAGPGPAWSVEQP